MRLFHHPSHYPHPFSSSIVILFRKSVVFFEALGAKNPHRSSASPADSARYDLRELSRSYGIADATAEVSLGLSLGGLHPYDGHFGGNLRVRNR